MKTILLTSLALIAFAGNSILCRLALGDNEIDAVSFTWIRLLSGVLVLLLILKLSRFNCVSTSKGSWKASFMLFLYAIAFSFAYLSLNTGTGALILFASVQITIIVAELVTGKKLLPVEWLGAFIAFLGFVYLVIPGLSTPSLTGFILMTFSGVAWGFYTLAGRSSQNPLADTTYNFVRTLPFVLILGLVSIQESRLSTEGVILAVVSGGVTSGIGYMIWYIALAGLSGTQSAVVQLLVPVIAAIGGVLFTNETLSMRLVLSSLMILGGILTLISGKHFFVQRANNQTK
ncbi:DMT family transporter [Endozoicomonas sp. 2B-B]